VPPLRPTVCGTLILCAYLTYVFITSNFLPSTLISYIPHGILLHHSAAKRLTKRKEKRRRRGKKVGKGYDTLGEDVEYGGDFGCGTQPEKGKGRS
jgi:hypothetical protein